MATNANRANTRNTNRNTNRKPSSKKNNNVKIIIFAIEVVVIIALLALVWVVIDFTGTKEGEGTNVHPGFESGEDAGMNPGIAGTDTPSQGDTGNNSTVHPGFEEGEEGGINADVGNYEHLEGYWNIALFGLDAINSEQLFKQSRSDSIIIASIHKETGEIKLVSVYRDTYLNVGNDKYTKCNAAYSRGGANQAISMLNMNLDLNIQDFVAVGYPALMECIDALGGVWIDVDKEELKHINNYQTSILRDVDSLAGYELVKVTETGLQQLNGLQAAAYCRIRQTAGDDFKRAERQREVIKAMTEKAQSASLSTLLDTVKAVAPNVYSTFDLADVGQMTELLKNIGNYAIVDEGGFPNESLRTTGNIGSDGSCVIPLNLEKNVIWLHEFLFGKKDYVPTNEVKNCSSTITTKTSPYLNKTSQ